VGRQLSFRSRRARRKRRGLAAASRFSRHPLKLIRLSLSVSAGLGGTETDGARDIFHSTEKNPLIFFFTREKGERRSGGGGGGGE